MDLNVVYQEDCVGPKGMCQLPDNSVDMILCDPPYGQTARNKWDVILSTDQMWKEYRRVAKNNAAITLFSNGMYTANLMISNQQEWRYNLVWNKVIPSGFLNAKRMPLRNHEDICVFYRKLPAYNPQMTIGNKVHSRGKAVGKLQSQVSRNTNYRELKVVTTEGNLKYPVSILVFSKPHPSITIHSTQKPVALFEYLIKTYTNEGAVVLDNCMGSGTTAIACLNTNRHYIGYENDPEMYIKMNDRILNHKNKG